MPQGEKNIAINGLFLQGPSLCDEQFRKHHQSLDGDQGPRLPTYSASGLGHG